MSDARPGQLQVLDGAGATSGWATSLLAPGAAVVNGTLILAPGSSTDTRVHFASEFASFAAAITALSPLGSRWLIVSTLQTLTAAVDVPSNITILCEGAGGFTSASSYDLTFRGGFAALFNQVFFGSVNVKFVQSDSTANPTLGEVFAEWWGAVGNDSTNDTAAFNSALNAMKTSRGIALRLLARPYRASVTIPAPSSASFPVVIIGSGDGSAIRTNSASSPAVSLDLGVSDPNTTLIFRDFSLGGRGSQSVPVLSLKAQAGTGNRFFGVLDNLKIVGAGSGGDCVYMKGGLGVDINIRTEEGRYALYLEESSNTLVRLHAGNNTCNGVMVKGGGNVSILRARIEDSTVANTRTISSISGSGSLVTVNTTTAHGLEDMDRVTISGVAAYNFTAPRTITVVDADTFTYAGAETGASGAGTVRISSSVLRLKNASFGEYRNVANEGKAGIDYTLWIQSDGTTATGTPNASHNTFSGCEFGPPSTTVRDGLATVLLEGPCIANESFGTTFGKRSGITSGDWEFLLIGNASNVRPRLNKFRGHVYIGSGNTGTIKYSEPIEGAYGNRVELSELSGQKTYRAGYARNITSNTSIDELATGSFIYTNGAGANLTISMFASFAHFEPIWFVNDSAYTLSIDPNGTETIGGGAAGVAYDIPTGKAALIGCSVAGVLDVLATTVAGSGGVSDGDKGDVTVSASGATWTIDNNVVTYAKMQDVSATDKLLGRSTAGAGDVEEITCTAAARALLDDANAAAMRTTLGAADSSYMPTFARVTGSNATTSSTTLVDITGLSIALAANSTYEFTASLTGNGADANGVRFGVNFSAAGASVEAGVIADTAGTGTRTRRISALNTSTAQAFFTSANDVYGLIQGVIITGVNPGNLTVQHLKVTSGTSTIYVNSFLKVTKIA